MEDPGFEGERIQGDTRYLYGHLYHQTKARLPLDGTHDRGRRPS